MSDILNNKRTVLSPAEHLGPRSPGPGASDVDICPGDTVHPGGRSRPGAPPTGGQRPPQTASGRSSPRSLTLSARRDPMHPTLRGLRRPPEPLIPSCWPRPPGTSRKGSSYARPHPDRNLVPFRSLSAHDPWPRASNDPTSSGAAPLATCPVRVSEKRRQAWGTGREPAGGISSCQEACGPRRGESPGPGPPLQTRTSYLVRARLPSSDVGRERLGGVRSVKGLAC